MYANVDAIRGNGKRMVTVTAILLMCCAASASGEALPADPWDIHLDAARKAALPPATTLDERALYDRSLEILATSCKEFTMPGDITDGNLLGQVEWTVTRIRALRATAEDVQKKVGDLKSLEKTDSKVKENMLENLVAAKKRCDRNTITLEYAVRSQGRDVETKISDLKKKSQEPNNDAQTLNDQLGEYQKALNEIQRTISFTKSDQLVKTFDDYDGFYYKFNLGFEYATVKTVFQKGFPRMGLLIYHQYTPDIAKVRDGKAGWKLGEVHTSLSAKLTSSAEEPTKENPTAGDPTINAGDQPSLDYDIQLFLPTIKTVNFGNLWSEVGPILLYGGSKNDDVTQIHQRYYGGVRIAINPELYTDVLYGKTEGLKSQRLEIRGQMPFYRTPSGSPFVIGAVANLGVRKFNSDTYKEADSIRIYVSWDIDMKDIFKVFNGQGNK